MIGTAFLFSDASFTPLLPLRVLTACSAPVAAAPGTDPARRYRKLLAYALADLPPFFSCIYL